MFFFCAPEPKVKSAERAFEEACVEKNALRAYAATYSKLEDVQKDDSPWKPVFEGHLLKSVYANTAELKVLIENTADMQWISISGTDAPETVLVDSELESKNDFGVAMHKGVLRVASDVHDAIAPFLEPTKALRITGHSVGGAAAHAIAYRLARAGHSIEQCVTFGAPKFTDAAGARKLEKADLALLRVTASDDAVTALPPPKLDVGWFIFSKRYTQAGPELPLSAGGAPMTYAPEPLVDDKASAEKAEQTWANVTWLAQAEESRMKAYLQAMKPTTDVKVQFHQILAEVST